MKEFVRVMKEENRNREIEWPSSSSSEDEQEEEKKSEEDEEENGKDKE